MPRGCQSRLKSSFPGVSAREKRRGRRTPGSQEAGKGGRWRAKCSYQHQGPGQKGTSGPADRALSPCAAGRVPTLPSFASGRGWPSMGASVTPAGTRGCRAWSHEPGLCHQLLGRVMMAEQLVLSQLEQFGRVGRCRPASPDAALRFPPWI